MTICLILSAHGKSPFEIVTTSVASMHLKQNWLLTSTGVEKHWAGS